MLQLLMNDDATNGRVPTPRAFHDVLSQLSHDPAAPPPDSLNKAVAFDPVGVHLELLKEGTRNNRRLEYVVNEIMGAVERWLDPLFQTLMPMEVYVASDEARKEWLDKEGFNIGFEPLAEGQAFVGTYVLRHKERVVSTFELKGTSKSKLEVPR